MIKKKTATVQVIEFSNEHKDPTREVAIVAEADFYGPGNALERYASERSRAKKTMVQIIEPESTNDGLKYIYACWHKGMRLW